MGCASSTPMIATAGSDMLKAATHVASDAAKSAENAVEDVTEAVGKTLDSAKETVGTAVTGITHDLGNVFTEKSAELDTAKNQLLEKLHLGGATKALEHTSEASANQLDTAALDAAARAPTPPPDLDSLKTSTPEPEIERAMANSHEDTPPTPKPTIAELEKLTAEVKQTAQITAATATAVTDSVAEVKHTPAEASTGTTAATEPAVDMIAWLVAEKRPGTTEWEKHADRLSKTRKMNEFKGGGKFRHFQPRVAPPHFVKSTENINIKRALLDDDSCYSDAYYNSHSSPTNSDSPKLRRARLPINGVLATNAKRMQREFATFVSNRRSTASILRSLTVSPALGRRFDYNSQRARITSPTPSAIAYTRTGYGTAVIVDPELLHNPPTANWQGGVASARLTSPSSQVGRAPRAIAARLDSPLASNVITQSKLKTTKAFAPLRGETTGRSRIFGQTRSGSPVNRRVFARRSTSTREGKVQVLHTRSTSPERVRTLIQGKVEAGRKRQLVAQTPTTIKLEREASVKESKQSSTGEITANVFTLSNALSPIKKAAETHSLPHLRGAEHKPATPMAHSMLEVVEHAVERAKNDGLSQKTDVKVVEKNQREVALEIIESSFKGKETPKIQKKTEKGNDEKQKGEKKIDGSHKSTKYEKSQATTDNNAAGSDASSSRNKKKTPSPMKQNSKRRSTAESKDGDVSGRQRSASPDLNVNNSQIVNFAVKGRFSMSPIKSAKSTYPSNNRHSNNWVPSSPGSRGQSSSHNRSRDATFNMGPDYRKGSRNSATSSPSPIQRDKHKHLKNELLNNGHVRKLEQTNNNNKSNGNPTSVFQNNWTTSSRRNSKDEHLNISKRFHNYTGPGLTGKQRRHSPISPRKPSAYNKNIENIEIFSDRDETNHSTNNAPDHEKALQTQHNWTTTNDGRGIEHSSTSTKISNSNSINTSKSEIILYRDQEKFSENPIYGKNYKQNNNEFKLHRTKDSGNIQTENHFENDKHENSHIIFNGQGVTKMDTSIHLPTTTTSSTKYNSPNSSPSKSSKSSTSIVIRTHLSSPETEGDNEVALSAELLKALRLREQLNEEVDEDKSVHTSCSVEENSQNDLEDSLRTDHEDSSRTDYEETVYTDTEMELRLHTDLDISSSSLDDIINRLSPQTAYLNLGRSATMMTLRSTTPIFNAPSSFRSTPHGSPYRQRRKYYSPYDSDQLEKVPFVAEFSSVARSRSPQVPASPYKMRARCAVCNNKYVINSGIS